MMDSEIFEDCLSHWKNSNGYSRFWPELAVKYNYENGEQLRNKFKKEKKKRGISKEGLKESEVLTETVEPNVKILVLDLELSYMLAAIFELATEYVSYDNILSDQIILCWSSKYLHESNFRNACLTPDEALRKDDSRIVKELHDLISKSDILIGHNLTNFDLKKLNVRFLKHGLTPVRKQIIDTYLIARNSFSFPSNSLKNINKILGIHQKKETDGIKLWMACLEGNKESLDILLDYCNHDILCTTELLYKLRPFMKNPPNLSVYFEGTEIRCNNCGHEGMKEDGTFTYTNSAKYKNYRCESCGAILRTKENLLGKEKRKSLLS